GFGDAVLGQGVDVGEVPGGEVGHLLGEDHERHRLLRASALVSMPLAQQMMLEYPVHCMHVVEHLHQYALVEIRQTVEVSRDDLVQPAGSPILVVNGVGGAAA